MRRLKRSAERAAAAAASHSFPLPTTVRFNASKRIPSWNVIARENSTGSLEEDLLTEAASSLHQGTGGSTGQATRNPRTHRYIHDGSDSESECADLNSWTRSGGPLMRTTSADQFVDFVQNLEIDTRMNRGTMGHLSNTGIQPATRDQMYHGLRVTTPDRMSSDTEYDQYGSRTPTPVGSSSSMMVAEGDLLQPERIQNGIVFNIVRKEVLTPSGRNQESLSDLNSSMHESVVECVQLDCPEKEMDATSVSESGEDVREDICVIEDNSDRVLENPSGDDVRDKPDFPENPSGDDVCDKHVTGGE